MSLLYVACGSFKGMHLVKYGITKHETHNPRLATHERSRDNPLGTPLGPLTDVAVVHTRGLWRARAIETAVRRAACEALGILRNPWRVGPDLTCISSSGEWLGRAAECCCRECVATTADIFFEAALWKLRERRVGWGVDDAAAALAPASSAWRHTRALFEMGLS